MAVLILLSSIPDILNTADAIKIVNAQLGYPVYIIPFLGVAKFIGVIVILIPGFNKLKEWAYAGLVFDLIGAAYSMVASGMAPFYQSLMILIWLAPLFASYYFHHKRMAV